jgi:hypothetical protein
LENEDEDAGLDPETGEPLLTLAEILRGDEVSGDEVYSSYSLDTDQ